MGKLQNGAIALAVSAAMLSGGTIGASAQDDDGGPEDSGAPVAAGTLDDGSELLGLAGISLEDAVAAAHGAASGAVGEADLEYVGDVLVFNVDIGDQDVKVDAESGDVLSVDTDD